VPTIDEVATSRIGVRSVWDSIAQFWWNWL